MLRDRIKQEAVEAQKAGDKTRLETLRFLMGEIGNYEIEKYPPSVGGTLTDEDVLAVITKQVKRHNESIEMFKRGNRAELVAKEEAELVILKSYLPAQMTDEEIRSKVKGLMINNSGADFGTLMKLVMGELRGRVDGAVVAKLLKEL